MTIINSAEDRSLANLMKKIHIYLVIQETESLFLDLCAFLCFLLPFIFLLIFSSLYIVDNNPFSNLYIADFFFFSQIFSYALVFSVFCFVFQCLSWTATQIW